jgi:hypothetical protein
MDTYSVSAVTYDILSYFRKAVCPNLLAAWTNVSYQLNFTIFIEQYRYRLQIVEIQCVRKAIKK